MRSVAEWRLQSERPRQEPFDSPLEAAFWLWWLAFDVIDAEMGLEFYIDLHPQVEASGRTYKPDFVITPAGSDSSDADLRAYRDYLCANWPQTAVELDGHAFHEKTLEQVTYRNQRDRDLQSAGWRIFHFSFSEFSQNPAGCVAEVRDGCRRQAKALFDQWLRIRFPKEG
jgi:hypothetical protein